MAIAIIGSVIGGSFCFLIDFIQLGVARGGERYMGEPERCPGVEGQVVMTDR